MSDPRLGRIYVPDDRDWTSEKLHVNAIERETIPASMLWHDATVLDQGNYGTCVGNGWGGWGISEPIIDSYTEHDARAIYYEATVIDGTPDDPDAPGGGQQGSTVRSGAKAMQARGKLTAYAFTQSLSTLREWLANHGPVVFGTDWTADMFSPDGNGVIRATGAVEGGHCYLCIGYDTVAGTFTFRNSWGSGWGKSGDFVMSATDVQKLLVGIESPGEACMAAEVGAVPVPTPVPSNPDEVFAAVLRPWVAARHSGSNRVTATAAKAWLSAKNLTTRE